MICFVFVLNQDASRLLLRSWDGGHLISELAELPDVAAEIMGQASLDLWCNKCFPSASHMLDYLSLWHEGKDAV